jgi:hypothetical protein
MPCFRPMVSPFVLCFCLSIALMSFCLSVHPFIHLSVCLSANLFVHPSACQSYPRPSVRLSASPIHLCLFISLYISTSLSTCPFSHLIIRPLFFYLSCTLNIFYMSIHSSIRPSLQLSVHLFLSLSIRLSV